MSKLYDLLYSMIGSLNKSVRTESQTLTTQQKTQARANIGAMSADYVPPSQTAQQVGADPAGTAASVVATHNTAAAAHGDIRALIATLTERLNTVANSTDTDLDQLAELVAYIKDNRELIDQISTGKISTGAIADNLTTNDATRVLSAAQGVAIMGLIDAIHTSLANKPDLTEAELTALSAAIQ